MLTAQLRDRLIGLRDEHGLSDSGWARAAKQRQQDVSRFVNAQMKYPPLDFLDSLCRVFHRTLSEVLAQDIPPATLTKAQSQWLVRLKTMTPSERNAFETLMERDQGIGSKR